MAEFQLSAAPFLGGYDKTFQDLTLTEATDLAIVSIALPVGGEDPALTAIKSAFGTEAPDVGASVLSKDKTYRLARLGRDQLFVLFDHADPGAERRIAEQLGGAAYTTDQSDVWVGLRLSGSRARGVLERICPLDLHPDAFSVNAVARTTMEHLGTIILRTNGKDYLLLSGSSSAASFLHALEVSISNTA